MKRKTKSYSSSGEVVQGYTVLEDYGGRATNEQRIKPGTYAENDPRLFGLGAYLVEIGVAHEAGKVATWTDETVVEMTSDEITDDSATPDDELADDSATSDDQ